MFQNRHRKIYKRNMLISIVHGENSIILIRLELKGYFFFKEINYERNQDPRERNIVDDSHCCIRV